MRQSASELNSYASNYVIRSSKFILSKAFGRSMNTTAGKDLPSMLFLQCSKMFTGMYCVLLPSNKPSKRGEKSFSIEPNKYL